MKVKEFSTEFTAFMTAMGYEMRINGRLQGGGGWYHPLGISLPFATVTIKEAVDHYTRLLKKSERIGYQNQTRDALLPLMGLTMASVSFDDTRGVVCDDYNR